MPKGEYTRAAKIAKAEATEEKWTMLRLALYYALGHDIGACAVVSTKLFPGVTKMMVHNAINGRDKALLGVRYQSDVLTKEEELKLCDWIAACARGKDPVKDGAVGEEGGGIGIGQGDARCLRALPPAVCVRCEAVPDDRAGAVPHVRRRQEVGLRSAGRRRVWRPAARVC